MTPYRAALLRVASALQQWHRARAHFSKTATTVRTLPRERPLWRSTAVLSVFAGGHVSRHGGQLSSAMALQRRLYATTPPSGSGGATNGAHHHHGGDGKGNSATSVQSSSSASGASNSGNSANGSSSNNNCSSNSNGSSNTPSSASNATSRSTKLSAAKKVKIKGRKGKAIRWVKRKPGTSKTAAANAASASASPANAGTTAATAGTASGSSGGGGSSSAGSNSNNKNSSGGSASGAGRSSSGSRRSSSARTRAAARRRKNKVWPRAAAAGAVSSASAGTASSGASGAGSSGARKKLLSREGSHSGSGRRSNSSSNSGRRGGRSSESSSSVVAASSSSSQVIPRSKKKHKKIRICVLSSSYDGADSATASVDNYWCTPQHYIKKHRQKYTFADVSMKKIDSYRTVRELVTSHKYDVFFNLCDGGRDEKRAGVDVVEALEEHNAAFTGTDSRSFEPSKIDMKLMVGSSGVKVPNFVLLDNEDGLAKKCRHLKFPVIVKHLSGYASVGIHKDNRCDNLDQLKAKVRTFIKEYNHALVEEFIRGREGTVLACADSGSPFGVKVFKPLMFHFLQNNDDFAYFDKKWTMECNDQAYGFLPSSDPAYTAIVEMARNAFKYIMNGVGYGRVDFRIDEQTGVPCFLEINPNCGMWYAPKDGGDFADVMVEGDPHWNHERFVANAVARALKEQAARKPWYFISHDRNGQFSTRASKTVPEGKCLFGDAVHPIPVVSKALYKLGEEEPTVGCVICRGDGIHHAVALRHSCEPNMQFVHGRTLLFAAKRQINVGEELTVDYATLRDESMPHFVCSCGTQNCRSVIFPMPATARSVEGKAMKRLLREKRRVWLKEKADRAAERILKKRSSSSSSSSLSTSNGSSTGGGTSSGSNGSGGASSSFSGSSSGSGNSK